MPAIPSRRSLIAWLAAASLSAQEPAPPPTPAPPTTERAMLAFQASQREHAEHVAAHGKALAWLAAHQEQDGRVRSGDVAAGDRVAAVASTAAALLAFGSGGSTMKVGAHRQHVRLATSVLIDMQREDGWLCDPAHESAGLVHALAAAAVVQAYVDSAHRPYAASAARALRPFAVVAAEEPLGEPLALAIGALAARRLGSEPGSPLGVARLAPLLAANGSCPRQAGGFAMVGALPATYELAAVAVALACGGTAEFADADPRWKALAARVRDMPTRFGKDGELLDAATLWCASDVAFQLGGDARAAFERVLRERIVPRFLGAAAAGGVTFACGPKVLRNEAAETALTALALAVPWYRVGR